MAKFRITKAIEVTEYWTCDVEAPSEEEAYILYNSDEEIFNSSEINHSEIIKVEGLNEYDN